jgi:hypothetical protein
LILPKARCKPIYVLSHAETITSLETPNSIHFAEPPRILNCQPQTSQSHDVGAEAVQKSIRAATLPLRAGVIVFKTFRTGPKIRRIRNLEVCEF